jgi:hypothetical protein
MYLCIHLQPDNLLQGNEVTDPTLCNSYIAVSASSASLQPFTYDDANHLLGATAGLFALVVVFKLSIKFLLNR